MKDVIDQINQKYLDFSIGNLRTGYFMLYRNPTGLFGRLIRDHQLSMGFPEELAGFTHVDVLGPQQWAIRVTPPKAKVVDIKKSYYGQFAVMLRYDNHEYDLHRDKVAWWAVSNNNKPYDLWGVAKFKLPFLFHKKDLPFCSENAVEALKKEYPTDQRIEHPYKIPPAGMFLFCKVAWAGVIK
jgi:hypothetical protein